MYSKTSHKTLRHGLVFTDAFIKRLSGHRFQSLHQVGLNRLIRHDRRFASSRASYSPEQVTILSTALRHVPEHGFTDSALLMAIKESGYLDITTNLFPQGPFEIAKFHLVTQRESLGKFTDSEKWKSLLSSNPRLSVSEKIRVLCVQRLEQNKNVIHRWPEAITLMKTPSNLQASATELFELSNAIWNSAGDSVADASWYTKRGILSGIYASTEIYMTQDKSPGFVKTWEFLDQRLSDSKSVGSTIGRVGQYLDYARYNFANVLRSKGMRI